MTDSSEHNRLRLERALTAAQAEASALATLAADSADAIGNWLADGGPNLGASRTDSQTVDSDLTGRVAAAEDLAERARRAEGRATVLAAAVAAGWVPENSVAPAVTGTPEPGEVLTCSSGTWSRSPASYAYQWLADGEPIEGATTNSYTVQAGDVGDDVSCAVTATNTRGESEPAESNALTIVSGE